MAPPPLDLTGLVSTPASRWRELVEAEARYAQAPRRPEELGPTTYGRVPVVRSTPLDLGGLVQAPVVAATPAGAGLVRRATDVLLTPVVSPETARRLTGSPAPLPERGLLGTLRDVWDAAHDLPRLLIEQPAATLTGRAPGELVRLCVQLDRLWPGARDELRHLFRYGATPALGCGASGDSGCSARGLSR